MLRQVGRRFVDRHPFAVVCHSRRHKFDFACSRMLQKEVNDSTLKSGYFGTHINFGNHVPGSHLRMFKRLPYVVDRAEGYTTIQRKHEASVGKIKAYPRPVNFLSQWSRVFVWSVSLMSDISSCLLATRALLVENFGSVGRSGRSKILSAKSLN